MKKRNYEKFSLLFIFLFIVIFWEMLFVLFLFKSPLNKFREFSCVVFKDRILQIVVSDDDLRLIESNHKFFINDISYNYSVKNIERNVLRRNKKYYHFILIEHEKIDKLNSNETISIFIFDKKISAINMFKIIWKEDVDGET